MNNNNNQPQMSYGEAPTNYSDVDDITRPILENDGRPTVNSIPDPYLQNETYYDDWDNPPIEVSETDGRPTLPTLKDSRRLS